LTCETRSFSVCSVGGTRPLRTESLGASCGRAVQSAAQLSRRWNPAGVGAGRGSAAPSGTPASVGISVVRAVRLLSIRVFGGVEAH